MDLLLWFHRPQVHHKRESRNKKWNHHWPWSQASNFKIPAIKCNPHQRRHRENSGRRAFDNKIGQNWWHGTSENKSPAPQFLPDQKQPMQDELRYAGSGGSHLKRLLEFRWVHFQVQVMYVYATLNLNLSILSIKYILNFSGFPSISRSVSNITPLIARARRLLSLSLNSFLALMSESAWRHFSSFWARLLHETLACLWRGKFI